MSTGFGARLKREREMRGVSLHEIARNTKISTRLLAAIEADDFSVLPGGVFNRGFIRSYARCLGLNEDDVVNDYLQAIGGLSHPAPADAPAPAPPISPAPPAPSRISPVVVVAILGGFLALAALAFLVKSYRRESRARVEPAAQASAAAQTQPARTPTPVETVPGVVINEFAPMPEKEAPAQKPVAPIAIQLDFQDKVWVKLALDGTPQPPVVYRAGDKAAFTAEKSVEIIVGNAGGFTYMLNGKPGLPLGGPGQVRRAVITPEKIAAMQVQPSNASAPVPAPPPNR